MNTEALFLFLILLLGLVLCSFLGGNCNKEGFDDSISGMFDAGVNDVDTVVGGTANAIGSVVGGTANVLGTAANSFSNGFDNYNHYSGTATSSQLQNGMTFIDTSGNTVTVVVNSNGTQSLQLLQVGQTTPMVLNSTPPSSSNVVATTNTFYAPIGNITATVITGSNGQIAIQFNLPNGQNILFTQSGSNSNSNSNSSGITSTQYYGSTGYPIQSGGYSLAYQGPNGGNAGYAQGPYGGNAGYVQGPNGNTAGYAQGPNGNTVAGSSSSGYGNQYYSTMPQGIPASQIPNGQEDLYILKSEIVPPVCPACPSSAACPRQEKCPPCPACARCPEPAFECKKVPNYNAIDSQYLPSPVLNDFSTFGM